MRRGDFFLRRLFFIFCLVSLCHCTAWAAVRPAAVAGMFYPADKEVLEKTIEAFSAAAQDVTPIASSSRLVGLIVPHAGYQYSGKTAAKAFAAVAGQKFDRIYFLGLDHHSGLSTISVWPEGAYDTPLGPVPVDASATAELLKSGVCTTEAAQHLREHSIEVLLPFSIKTLGFRPSVFISIGGGPENGRVLGMELIRELAGFPGRVLLIASSDWSHYHNASEAAQLDSVAIKSVIDLDSESLISNCKSGKAELCGLSGVVALLEVMKAASATVRLLERTDSSEASGDKGRVVGYASIVFEADTLPKNEPKAQQPTKAQHEEGKMNEFQKESLAIVRKTLEAVLNGKPKPSFAFKDPRFNERHGVFVTLKEEGELRGCIGMIEGREPLGQALQDMAIAAALEDPRFDPVKPEELPKIDIEVSILSPLIPVKDLKEIEVGRDGLLLRKYPNSGLLLPQVAVEYGWDRDTFLDHLCLKAGLPPKSHLMPDAKLWRFTAEVFGEKDEK